jgi:hypothetical protein
LRQESGTGAGISSIPANLFPEVKSGERSDHSEVSFAPSPVTGDCFPLPSFALPTSHLHRPDEATSARPPPSTSATRLTVLSEGIETSPKGRLSKFPQFGNFRERQRERGRLKTSKMMIEQIAAKKLARGIAPFDSAL